MHDTVYGYRYPSGPNRPLVDLAAGTEQTLRHFLGLSYLEDLCIGQLCNEQIKCQLLGGLTGLARLELAGVDYQFFAATLTGGASHSCCLRGNQQSATCCDFNKAVCRCTGQPFKIEQLELELDLWVR